MEIWFRDSLNHVGVISPLPTILQQDEAHMSDTRCFWPLVGPLGNEKHSSEFCLVDVHGGSFCEDLEPLWGPIRMGGC